MRYFLLLIYILFFSSCFSKKEIKRDIHKNCSFTKVENLAFFTLFKNKKTDSLLNNFQNGILFYKNSHSTIKPEIKVINFDNDSTLDYELSSIKKKNEIEKIISNSLPNLLNRKQSFNYFIECKNDLYEFSENVFYLKKDGVVKIREYFHNYNAVFCTQHYNQKVKTIQKIINTLEYF